MIHLPKSQPAPDCLATEKAKKNGTYNCGDVVTRLRTDFKNKCYICENRDLLSINIEHFQSHKENPDLKFDWNNLYFCCAHCNNIKSTKAVYDEILNCADPADEVDVVIEYCIGPIPKEKASIIALVNNDKVNNTVALLLDVYNGTTPQKQIESAGLRKKLQKELRDFTDLLVKFYELEFDEDLRLEVREKVAIQLRPSSCFTAFKRWIIRKVPDLNNDFGGLIE